MKKRKDKKELTLIKLINPYITDKKDYKMNT